MRGRARSGLLLLLCACSPGPASATGDDANTETDSNTETGSECTPGEFECECLPDGTCLEWDYAIHCGPSHTSMPTCTPCWVTQTIESPPCVPPDCPSDCVIDLDELPAGPIYPLTIPYVSIEDGEEHVPITEDCESQDGWSWLLEGEQIALCGAYCDAWMNPGPEGTRYELIYGCPPWALSPVDGDARVVLQRRE